MYFNSLIIVSCKVRLRSNQLSGIIVPLSLLRYLEVSKPSRTLEAIYKSNSWSDIQVELLERYTSQISWSDIQVELLERYTSRTLGAIYKSKHKISGMKTQISFI